MGWEQSVWWHVYPLGAVGAPIFGWGNADAGHRLARLVGWLDYACELGCTGLLLGPVFASTTHGYDTLDHFRIDPRLGDEADFELLVAEASRRGLCVVLDGVFNHVGADHPAVAEALSGRGTLVRVEQGRGVGWEGHDSLVGLDHAGPQVEDLVVEVMLHWLRRGIAGWRLDVAYAVPSQFWRQVTTRVRTQFPHAFFLGEVIHGDYAGIARAGGLDAVTQYELWKATWSALADRNLWELAWAIQRHDALAGSLIPQTFVGNHDVFRIASRVGDAGAALAACVLLTLPGLPSIYYGDEQAFRGEKGEGFHADAPLRPPLPEGPGGLAPYGGWLHDLYRDLIALRRAHPWIASGRVRVVGKDCTWITYEVRGEAGQRLEVRLELDPAPRFLLWVNSVEAYAWG